MAHSIAACYVQDDGTQMECKRVFWDDFTRLQDDRKVVAIFVYWDQSGNINRNEFFGDECYSMRRAPPQTGGAGAANIEITACNAQGGPGGQNAAKDIALHDDGVKARIKNWPSKLFQAAMAGPVRLLAYDWDAPNFDALVNSARTMSDSTPIEGDTA